MKPNPQKSYFQFNKAVNLRKDGSQWIDLAFHPEACLTNKYICGQDGGALSMWLNIRDCSDGGGIITTEEDDQELQTGFNIFCALDTNDVL